MDSSVESEGRTVFCEIIEERILQWRTGLRPAQLNCWSQTLAGESILITSTGWGKTTAFFVAIPILQHLCNHWDEDVMAMSWSLVRTHIDRSMTALSHRLSTWSTTLQRSSEIQTLSYSCDLSLVGPMLERPRSWNKFAIQLRTLASTMKERIWCVSCPVVKETPL